jgi:SAM-dependent methyltransferase
VPSRSCPLCAHADLIEIAHRDLLPVMQNVCYPTRALALASARARFDLSACGQCGFLFNSTFDAALLRYEVGYDNHVESRLFEAYYEKVARFLIARFELDRGGVVYDVGCGRGTFLKVLCELCPSITGIGIDPSCEPSSGRNVQLVRSEFSEDLITRDARLVILRHVLEHIARPIEFMIKLREASRNVPIFVEVPDAQWIFAQGAFWDLCYEHCNYFVPATLRNALRRAGLRVSESGLSFENQYQWAICAAGTAGPAAPEEVEDGVGPVLEAARSYAVAEGRALDRAQRVLGDAAREGPCTLWGMSTKGVVLASMMPAGMLAGGIDSNPQKQGLFAPGSGLAIHGPHWLKEIGAHATVIAMNPNYLTEIGDQIRALGVLVTLRTL